MRISTFLPISSIYIWFYYDTFMDIDFFHVEVTEEAIRLVTDVLRSGWLNEGEYVRKFEDALAPWMGRHPLAVNSCTSALHLALFISRGGCENYEVLIPAQTFVATATAAIQAGCKPVFVDINPQTGNISVEDMKRKITDRTLAVMPVHFGGMPCDMDEINAIAKQHALLVVEDAAHALGATYKGNPVGMLSDYACFSFQCIKMVTTGDGGAITVPSGAEEVFRDISWFGINKQGVRKEYNERVPSIHQAGFKYNMNNITAAIGLGNITQLATRLAKRRRVAKLYREELAVIKGLQLMKLQEDRESAYWLFPVLVEDRPHFFAKMTDAQIPVKMVNWGIDQEPCFAADNPKGSLPGQRYFDAHHMCIPLHDGLTDDQIQHIVSNIKAGW